MASDNTDTRHWFSETYLIDNNIRFVAEFIDPLWES